MPNLQPRCASQLLCFLEAHDADDACVKDGLADLGQQWWFSANPASASAAPRMRAVDVGIGTGKRACADETDQLLDRRLPRNRTHFLATKDGGTFEDVEIFFLSLRL